MTNAHENSGVCIKALNTYCGYFNVAISCIVVCMLWAYLAASPLSAAEEATIAAENEIKSVYIFNFIRFTEWPDDLQSQPSQETTLSILGNLSLLKIFKRQAFQQAAYGVRLKVHGCISALCMKESQALFIDKTAFSRLKKTLNLLKNRPVLTISDISGFADRGGMIELKRRKDKVSFRINLQAIQQAGLYVSAQLLQLAEIVGEKP